MARVWKKLQALPSAAARVDEFGPWHAPSLVATRIYAPWPARTACKVRGSRLVKEFVLLLFERDDVPVPVGPECKLVCKRSQQHTRGAM